MSGIDTLVINEIFGPTVQGEGPASGRIAAFVRLMGCNLTCSWCDSKQTWDASHFDLKAEGTRMTVQDIVSAVLRTNARLVVLTGGEPLLQQHYPGFLTLLRHLHAQGIQIHVETNGTVVPDDAVGARVAQFVVSPKLSNAGMDDKRTLNAVAIKALKSWSAHFKFVCRTPEDVVEAARVAVAHHIPARRVWIMPEGITAAEVCDHLAQVADMVVLHSFNLSPRLHILAWGNERGR